MQLVFNMNFVDWIFATGSRPYETIEMNKIHGNNGISVPYMWNAEYCTSIFDRTFLRSMFQRNHVTLLYVSPIELQINSLSV